MVCNAPKSNSAHDAINLAMEDVRKGNFGPVPRQLQNMHADTTGFDSQQHYLYPHDFPNRWVDQQYLPDVLKNTKYYEWGDNKTEQAAKAYWEKIKGKPL
jgi:putative ATPase